MRGPRALALPLVCVTAVLGVALASPATAQPVTTEDAAEAAAGWLARQFVDGTRLQTVFDGAAYDDHGLTADGVLALDAADVGQDTAAAATAWLQANVATYAGSGSESYAGALAKLAVVADAQGEDPADFGGVDLLTRLDAQRAESGRWQDVSEYGDYSNTLTQALGVIAFARIEGEAPAAAVAYLESQQCDDGGFDITFDDPEGCVSEADATAFAAQALLAAGADDAAAAALDHLAVVQGDDGSFVGDGVANTNSTGVAAQALRAGGRDAEADAAVEYVLTAQIGCAGEEASRGAVTYVPGTFDATAARATAQAVGGVAGVALVDVSAEGDAAAAPVLACAPAPTTDPTPAPTTDPGPPPYGGTPPGHLPATGVDPAPYAALGVLLVLAGAGALVVARQRRRSY